MDHTPLVRLGWYELGWLGSREMVHGSCGIGPGRMTASILTPRCPQVSPACAQDILAYLPKLRVGGVIAGHDIGHARNFQGITVMRQPYTVRMHCTIHPAPHAI